MAIFRTSPVGAHRVVYYGARHRSIAHLICQVAGRRLTGHPRCFTPRLATRYSSLGHRSFRFHIHRTIIPKITAHTITKMPAMTHPAISIGLHSKVRPIWYVAVTSAVLGNTNEKNVIWKLALLSCSGLAYFQKDPTETMKNLCGAQRLARRAHMGWLEESKTQRTR